MHAASTSKKTVKADFHLPTEIFIRQNIIDQLADILQPYGSRVVLVTTSNDFDIYHETIEKISRQMKTKEIGCIIYDEIPNIPTTEDIDGAVKFIQKTNCNLIVGFGGAESINAAKAMPVLANNHIFCYDIFSNPTLSKPPIPLVTVPAYPIFGLEIAPFFYIDHIQKKAKSIFYHDNIYPLATVVDPSLSIKIEEDRAFKMTIAALAIAAESVISKENNDMINTYALKAIDLIFRNLPVAYSDSHNTSPRRYLSTASVMSGIAFSISSLSVTLAISLALASKTDIKTEDAMSIILPHIMDFNLTSSPGKYVQMAKVMGENVRDITVIEAAIKAVEAIRKLETDMDIPLRLSSYNISKTRFKDIANLSLSYPFINNTPRDLNFNEIETILIAAY
jgi:alcohol dehydrogenase class IV